MTVLVYIELQDGKPTDDSMDLLCAAGGLANEVVAVVADEREEVLAQLDSADLILSGPGYSGDRYAPDLHVDLLSAAIDRVAPGIVLIANSYVGIDLTASIATRQNWPAVTYCFEVALNGDGLIVQSRAYGGKIDARVELALPAIIGVNSGELSGAVRSGRMERDTLPAASRPSRFRFVEAIAQEADGVDIRLAEKLVAVGRGIGEEDEIQSATELAEALGAEIAGSRPIIDNGWLPKSRQVGKSGLKVSPKLYIALGISGAPEHLEGMGSADFIVAVNSDPSAPIFDVAHVGTTEDIEDVIPALIEQLEAERA
jgi:electron transfer flavoprotein alpha subunit